MASHSNAEQEEPTTGLPTTDSESDAEEELYSDFDVDEEEMKKWLPTTDSEFDTEEELYSDFEVDEEEMERWLSTTYERGSKKPMKKPLTAPWGLLISDADVEKLKVGVRSRDMDDKWDILIEDPDENGNLSIHIIRSWLQEESYIFHIVPKPSSDDGGSAMIQSITWEGNKSGWQCDVEQAQKEAVILSRGHLDCEFETLPEYSTDVFWQSSAYKAVDAE